MRIQANKAALKAVFINRFGDFGLFIAIMLIFMVFKTLDFGTIFILTPYFFLDNFYFWNYNINIIDFICFFLFVGVVGKSAQIGLHVWLPDAMEAPTPVSALLHAATMVTAGVFLIIRCSPLFEFSKNILFLCTIFGGLTAFLSATIGLVQFDFKKIIAYSTCSQLGYMVFVCGLSGYSIGLFHIINHAFFKALLFLSAGVVIHALGGEQDIRKFGNLNVLLPYVYSLIIIGSLSLAGFPFLSGFFSKDLILELACSRWEITSLFIYWLGTITAGLTAFYSGRLLYFVFITNVNGNKRRFENLHHVDIIMGNCLLFLSIFSIISGFFFKDIFIGLGSHFFNNAIFFLPENFYVIDAEFLIFYYKILPTIFSILGLFLSFFLFVFFENTIIKLNDFFVFRKIYSFLIQKWYFDVIYNQIIAKRILILMFKVFLKVIDKGFLELIMPNFMSNIFFKIALSYKIQQKGLIFQYFCQIIFFFNIFWIIFVNI